jgi:RNA polymerase sigma-70 factor (ECF subfamily)
LVPHPHDWQSWLNRHGPAALLFARQLTPHNADAEDALHDGFIRFWHHRKKSRDPVALLYTCIRTAALDQRRNNRRRKNRETVLAAELPQWFSETASDTETCESAEASLRLLSEDQRTIIILKIWADMTFQQIAATLNLPLGTVVTRYRAAMEKMSTALSPEVKNER